MGEQLRGPGQPQALPAVRLLDLPDLHVLAAAGAGQVPGLRAGLLRRYGGSAGHDPPGRGGAAVWVIYIMHAR